MLDRPISRAGWTRVAFGDVVRLSKARVANPEAAGIERVVGLEHIEPGDLRIRRWGDVADGTTFTTLFKPGQVLFGKRRAYQRKVAVADFEGVCSGDIYVLEPSNDRLLPELLPFLCQTDAFFDHAVGTSAGSLSPRTNWTSLASFEFLLPPIQEQARLVEALSANEAALNACHLATESGEELLRSMLIEAIPPVSTAKTRGLPLVRFGDVVAILDPNPSHRYPDYVEEGVPLVSTQDFVGEDGYDYAGCKRVPSPTFAEQKARCGFDEHDVVFARKGVLGLSRYYGRDEKCFSHTIVIMKPRGAEITREFLLWLTRSASFMGEIQRSMNSNSGVPTLGIETMNAVQVPLPSVAEQKLVVGQLETVNQALGQLRSRRVSLFALKKHGLSELAGHN
ncbi:restriction endonuclease subunit S [Rhizobium paknamense]|uniref:Type I restriction enzyme S subunit n=1 Tax=Rhizobium paknamense TaxID=1206817 RepID=A0ABU0I9I4_9HYPH|nr:restriction endonuclease subunit S [Rhizobium paknamense]MDQ0454893.1 type I restriction enzyme S subunit [Rhizobium paknamense]